MKAEALGSEITCSNAEGQRPSCKTEERSHAVRKRDTVRWREGVCVSPEYNIHFNNSPQRETNAACISDTAIFFV